MRYLTLATALLLLTPFALAATTHDRNVAYLWSLLGDQDPDSPATLPDGRVLTLDAAMDELAARAGAVDLRAPFHGDPADSVDILPHGFDIWVLDSGPGPCQSTVYGPGSPVFVPFHPSLWIYEADTAESWQDADVYQIIGWTLKTFEVGYHGHWWAFGNSDHYCIETERGHMAFPFLDGTANGGPGWTGE